MKSPMLLSLFLASCTIGLDSKYYAPENIDKTEEESTNEPNSQPSTEPGVQPSTEPSAQPTNEPNSQPSSSENPNLGECDDGIDNDNDGLSDCQDTDCNGSPVCMDADNDGYSAVEDCNDYNNAINPGASEIADDGIDQDCDGQDETTNSNGGGNNGNPTAEDCSNGIDDDQNGMIDCDDYMCILDPICSEDCSNGIDDNGNGMTDCDDYMCILDPACNGSSSGTDADSDGYDSISSGGNDCDDSDYNTHPGAGYNEISYNDCMTDVDNDGYGDDNPSFGIVAGTDCDDNSYYTNPGAYDFTADGTDQDCDGIDGPSQNTGIDNDNDGYDSISSGGTDCDDYDAYTYPGAAYWDSFTDCMTDVDGDNYGDENPSFGVTAGTDCDDSSYSINPGAYDYSTDGIDQDCDGIDGLSTGVDYDNDGYDSISSGGTDCDDYDAYTYPGAAYWDSYVDCMTDVDGDNYGDDTPNPGVTAGTDCDDSSYSINPGAYDYTTDGIDQDCDGVDYGASTTCASTEMEDCNGNCAPLSWLGDGFCDDENFTHMGNLVDLNCSQHNYDDGDCTTTTTCASYELEDCNGNCVLASYLGDGVCDNSTSFDLDCAQHNYDNGDCSSTITPTECCFDIYMYDSASDGWHSSYLHVYEDNAWASQHTLSIGGYGSDTACVPYGSRFDLAFSDSANTYSGIYDNEITYDLYDSNFTLLLSESDPPNGTRYTESYVTCN